MPRNQLPLLILLLIVSALVALWESPPQILQKPPSSSVQNYPVAYSTDTKTRQFAEDGRLKYELKTESIEYYQPQHDIDAEYAIIRRPQITFYSETSQPWHIQSEWGRLDKGGETITFTDNVVAWQLDEQQNRTELKTEELVTIPKREYAETDKAVKIISPDGVTNAVGMKAFLSQGRLQLLSRVRSTYEPI